MTKHIICNREFFWLCHLSSFWSMETSARVHFVTWLLLAPLVGALLRFISEHTETKTDIITLALCLSKHNLHQPTKRHSCYLRSRGLLKACLSMSATMALEAVSPSLCSEPMFICHGTVRFYGVVMLLLRATYVSDFTKTRNTCYLRTDWLLLSNVKYMHVTT